MELDVALRAVEAQLSELARRLGRQETRHVELHGRVEAWCARVDEDFATKNSVQAVSAKLAIEASACRRDLEDGLDEIRAEAASREDLRRACEAQAERFSAVGEAAAAAADDRRALHQGLHAAAARGEESSAALAEQREALDRLSREVATLGGELSQATQALERHGAEHLSARDAHREFSRRHDEHGLASQRAASSLEAAKAELAELGRYCREDLATAMHVAQLDTRIDTAAKVADAAVVSSRNVASELEHERTLIRRTVHDHAAGFADMRRLLDECLRSSDAKGNVARCCEVLGTSLDALESRTQCNHEASSKAMAALSQQVVDLQAEFLHHVKRLEGSNEETRQHTAKFCFKQMDDVVHLSKAVSEVEARQAQVGGSSRT